MIYIAFDENTKVSVLNMLVFVDDHSLHFIRTMKKVTEFWQRFLNRNIHITTDTSTSLRDGATYFYRFSKYIIYDSCHSMVFITAI